MRRRSARPKATSAAPAAATGLGLADDVNTPVLLVLTLALAGVIAAVSFRWVERPFFKAR